MPGPTEFLQVIALAVDKATMGIAIVRPDGILAYANAAAAGILGLSGPDLSGISVVALEPWSDTAGWEGRWAKLRAEGTLRHEIALGPEQTLETTDTYVRMPGGEYCVTALRWPSRPPVQTCPSCGASLSGRSDRG